MKIIKRINNRDYKVTYSPIPVHMLPDKDKIKEIERLAVSNANKIDLSDVTFLIPVRIESEDRKKCLSIVINYLTKYFNTKIIILEEGSGSIFPSIWKSDWEPYIKYIFRRTDSPLFHKTLNLNVMAKASTTPIIAALDSDCLFFPEQYVRATKKIREGTLDFCYPFNSPLYNIIPEMRDIIEKSLDLFSIHTNITIKTGLVPPGGCFFMNKAKFIEGGMENQRMISYGPEDTERRDRMMILGYNVGDVIGQLFHIDHERTTNSCDHNPLFNQNRDEYDKVRFMSKSQLKTYISTWEWLK